MSKTSGTRNATLLIVDDISANRELLARRFARSGFNTLEADSGAKALQVLETHECDVVLLDVMMPGLSGLEVLQRIRLKHDPMQLPVIMVTAKADGSDVAEALQRGANDYITKPVDFTAAAARVETQLQRKNAERVINQANAALRNLNHTLEQRIAARTADLVRINEELRKEIAERERSQAEVEFLAHHDSLTGLANRVLLGRQLQQAVARAAERKEALAVLFIDLDGFKGINDTLGHSTGDALLKCVAERLSGSIREQDKAARLGGDEFAVIQTEADQPKGAASLASRLIQLLGEPYVVGTNQLSVGASIGIAVAAEAEASDPEDLLKRADLAMYRAKADGRGTYRFFEADMDAAAQRRRTMEIALRAARIETDFRVYYQPLVDLKSKHVTCLEALLRWQHPQKGLVSPSHFIGLGEDIGLIVPLGEWVLRRACADAATWPAEVKVAVNLSPVQFKYGGLANIVRSALAGSGLPPDRLELEITESVLLEKTETSLGTLKELRELGVAISMDDFGTGYSSLSYLRSFRFDKVKIDRSFIMDLTKGEDSLAIVRAIAELGRSFGMLTVAEGVETEEQLRCLEQEGCSQVQGYLLSRPKPASEIATVIRTLHRAGTESASRLPSEHCEEAIPDRLSA